MSDVERYKFFNGVIAGINRDIKSLVELVKGELTSGFDTVGVLKTVECGGSDSFTIVLADTSRDVCFNASVTQFSNMVRDYGVVTDTVCRAAGLLPLSISEIEKAGGDSFARQEAVYKATLDAFNKKYDIHSS